MRDAEINIEYIINQSALFQNVTRSYIVKKRIFDFLFSLSAIIILSPIFIIIAFAIKLDTRGPVFFSQNRNGYKGKIFKMYKFRSMDINAENKLEELVSKNEVSGNMFKIRNDPRITKVGRFIRKTSIDELPQLFNVLKGDMSLVGPRPPIVREVLQYDSWHKLRLSVKPGLTGLWQVSGRSAIGFEEMCRLDLKYIRERSFFYDVKILIKTVPVLLGDSTAF